MPETRPENETAWHALSEDELVEKLDAGPDGLSDEQARALRERHGPNALEAEEGVTPLGLIVKQVRNPIIYLLVAAAGVSLVTRHFVDAAGIGAVVVLNTILGFVQEWRAEKALESLQKLSAPHARVLRDGREQRVEASEVVPGDLLVLETGDRVAADARLLEADELHVDESALTGESEPLLKSPGVIEQDKQVAERPNMVWMSTPVTAGRGRAIVVSTGMHTALGRIAGEVRSTTREDTPLQKRMARLGGYIAVAGITLATGIFFLGLLRGYGTMQMLLFAVAAAVSAIPSGLPAAISVTLALGVQRMAARNAIIRRMPAVETLGSTTVICSDKTGTITRNEMTVKRLYAAGALYSVTGEGYAPDGEIRAGDDEGGDAGAETLSREDLPEALSTLLAIGALANNASLDRDDGSWKIDGNPSEGALLAVARKAGLDLDALSGRRPRVAEIPFSSDRKYMAAMFEEDGRRVVYVKGGSERVLGFCTRALEDGGPVELDDRRRRQIEEAGESLASQALRVMAGAYREAPEGADDLDAGTAESDLTFAGLWGLLDPARAEAVDAIRDAQGAGIRVIMLTGDHPVTASAIAAAVGIAGRGEETVTGRELDEMSDEELGRRVMNVGVFARVSPAHKLKITRALKDNGQVVAMTGDGVNDAPALKGADIGVAMGLAGTEVAREAADMVLTDDDFATIVHAVEEGRVIFSNLRRVVFFLLTTNLGEILTLTFALLMGLDLPLTALMILWVNLITDGACTVPLGVEPRHWDVLKQPPRAPDSPMIDKVLVRRILMLAPVMAIGTLGLFTYQSRNGDFAHARTVAFTTLAAFQWFQALNARSQYVSVFSIGVFANRWLLVGVATAIVLQLAAVYTRAGHYILDTVPLAADDWVRIVLVASSIFVIDEVLKRFGVHGRLPATAREVSRRDIAGDEAGRTPAGD